MQKSLAEIISTPAQEFRWPLDGQRQILKLIADYLEGIDILTFADSSQSNFSGSLPSLRQARLSHQAVFGSECTFIHTTNGQVFLCGDDTMGMPGDAKIPWIKFSLPDLKESITQVAPGIGNTLMLSASGRLFAYGQNISGDLGLGYSNFVTQWTEVDTKSLGPVTQIIKCNYDTLLLTANGHLFAQGLNSAFCMGIGDKQNVASPTEVHMEGVKYPIRQVLMSELTCFVLDDDGQWFVCGVNNEGQLGVGDKEDRRLFTKVKWDGILEPIAQMIPLGSTTFLITTTGRVFTAEVTTFMTRQLPPLLLK